MNITEELDRMLVEMEARTGEAPQQIMCSPETLRLLWDRGGMLYSSDADIENGTGYAARYMGIPVVTSTTVEPGEILLSANTDSTSARANYIGGTPYCPTDWNIEESEFGRWSWASSPYSQNTSWNMEPLPAFSLGDMQLPSHDDVIRNAHTYFGRRMEEELSTIKQPLKLAQEEANDIDEDSFLGILNGCESDVSESK